LRHIRAQGFLGAIEWTKEHYPQRPFYRAHFFPYFWTANMYSWTFNPDISLSRVRECNEILVWENRRAVPSELTNGAYAQWLATGSRS
jgi:hypothetical protein